MTSRAIDEIKPLKIISFQHPAYAENEIEIISILYVL